MAARRLVKINKEYFRDTLGDWERDSGLPRDAATFHKQRGPRVICVALLIRITCLISPCIPWDGGGGEHREEVAERWWNVVAYYYY